MKYEISTTYNQCITKTDFNKLISNYPVLIKYHIRYDEEKQKTHIIIDDYEILKFINLVGEYICISTMDKKIIIDDNHI